MKCGISDEKKEKCTIMHVIALQSIKDHSLTEAFNGVQQLDITAPMGQHFITKCVQNSIQKPLKNSIIYKDSLFITLNL